MAAETLRATWAAETGYVTPKIDVRGAVFRTTDMQVLMVRETQDGLWTLPGGWVDVNDSPSGAIRREIEQEAGFQVRVVKLAALYDRNAHGHPPSVFHSWKAFFLCEIAGGQARGSHETDAVDFFPLDQLPPMSIGRCTAAAGAPHARALAATRAADRFRLRRGFSAGFVAKLSDRFDTRNLRSVRGRTRP